MNEPNTNDYAWERGLNLYESGDYWHAHEALEEIWLRTKNSDEGTFLRAAIQIAAAMVKASQGNMAGVRKNLGKARAILIATPRGHLGVDTCALASDCDRCGRHAQAAENAGNSFDWCFKPKIKLLPKTSAST